MSARRRGGALIEPWMLLTIFGGHAIDLHQSIGQNQSSFLNRLEISDYQSIISPKGKELMSPFIAEKLESRRPKLRSKRQGRPPSTDSEVTRTQIMDAAQLCFGERGYRETSNKIIADMANVTPGTIYHYFKNKRDLFLSIHDNYQQAVRERLRPIIEADMSLAESLEAMLQIFTAIYIDWPKYRKFNAVVRTESLRNPEISAAHSDHDWRLLYRVLAERGVKTGEIRQRDMRAFQATLSAIILGVVQHGIEATVTNHMECMQGILLLFRGEFLQPKQHKRKVGRQNNVPRRGNSSPSTSKA